MATSKPAGERAPRDIKVTGIRRETLDTQHISTIADVFLQQGLDVVREKRGQPPRTDAERKQFGQLLAKARATETSEADIESERPRPQTQRYSVSPVSSPMADPEAEPAVVAPRRGKRSLLWWIKRRDV